VNVHVFATDYDGTIAERNQVSETTARALERVRATGRKVLLVTGRMLPDLQRVRADARVQPLELGDRDACLRGDGAERVARRNGVELARQGGGGAAILVHREGASYA